MDAKHGIKELSEGMEAFLELGLALAELAHDGLQLADLPALYQAVGEEPLKSKLAAASDKMSHIPAEAKDLDLGEGMELAMIVLPYIARYVSAMSKGEEK